MRRREVWSMTKRSLQPGLFLWTSVALLAAGLVLIFSNQASAQEQVQGTEAYCLSCHSDPNLKMTLPSG